MVVRIRGRGGEDGGGKTEVKGRDGDDNNDDGAQEEEKEVEGATGRIKRVHQTDVPTRRASSFNHPATERASTDRLRERVDGRGERKEGSR